jgi:hypothetical protein
MAAAAHACTMPPAPPLHRHAAAAADWDSGRWATLCGTSCKVYNSAAPANGCAASNVYRRFGFPTALEVQYVGESGDGSYCG